MKVRTLKRTFCALSLPIVFLALAGCSNKPPETPPADQEAKQKEAEQKLRSSYATDPTLQPPGANKPPGGGAGMNPGPVPGQGTMNPGPVPGQGGR